MHMLTHPKLTSHILHMLMHSSSSHVTLLPGEFHVPELFPKSNLRRQADSHWVSPQISSSDMLDLTSSPIILKWLITLSN